jgi:hydrogenase maturation factor HypF (carbamoyltransferase family)
MEFPLATTLKECVLALGAESEGNFSIFHKNKVYCSENFGDLLDDQNFRRFKTFISAYLKKNRLTPDIILTDLHPLYRATVWGKKLAKKFGAQHIPVQHHHAHIFSAIGEKIIQNSEFRTCLPVGKVRNSYDWAARDVKVFPDNRQLMFDYIRPKSYSF